MTHTVSCLIRFNVFKTITKRRNHTEQLHHTHISDTNVYNFRLEQFLCDEHSVSYISNSYRNACRCSYEVDNFVDWFLKKNVMCWQNPFHKNLFSNSRFNHMGRDTHDEGNLRTFATLTVNIPEVKVVELDTCITSHHHRNARMTCPDVCKGTYGLCLHDVHCTVTAMPYW